MTIDELEVKFTGNIKDIQSKLKTLEKDVNGFNKNLSGIAKGVGAVFAADQVFQFTKEIIRTRGEFQKFEAVLTNTLGSRGLAKEALSEISEFAAKTPFQIDQLTGSFVKLANQGFVPSTTELRKLGDLASSTGKDFDMLTEAIIDAQVGEFERLKEFGIRAQKEGDKVKFTFKGVQTQTEFTEEAIRDYILSLGDLEGVTGSMAAISETLEGKTSNLEDSWTQFMNKLGTLIQGPGATTIDWLTEALDKTGQFIEGINQLNTDAALITTGFDSSAGEQLNNIVDLTERLAAVRRKLNRDIFKNVEEREAAEKQEKDLLELLKKQSEELGRQYKLDQDRKKLAEKRQEELRKERERQKQAEKDSKKKKEYRDDPLAFFDVEDSISDSDLDLSILDNISDRVAENLGQLTPTFLSEMADYLAEMDDELSQMDALQQLTEDYREAGKAAKQFSDDQKAAMLSAAATALLSAEDTKDAIRGIIKAFISQGIAAVISNTLKSAGIAGPLAIPLAGAAGGLAAKMFDSAIPKFASGVNNFSGGMALVGERGPELVNLPSGSDVIPNHRIGNYSDGGGFVASTKVVGEDLLIMIEKAQRKRDRLS
ncbi:hypothetical protein WJR50_18810 [Catalinimonas sp. 4WD22]|uniref:hypothetical protein n=1 Tax=Catalinimonas locisalis TaxID=3133978 RepID=UPI003101651F